MIPGAETDVTPEQATRALLNRPTPDESIVSRVRETLGGALLTRVGAPGRLPAWPGRLLRRKGTVEQGPDGTVLVTGGWVPRNAGGWTHGNWIILKRYDPPLSAVRARAILNHEYVHVLQYRGEGAWRFYWHYLRDLAVAVWTRRSVWEVSAYERAGVAVEALYRAYPDLPNLWELPEGEQSAMLREA